MTTIPKPTVGRVVLYRTDGRNGLVYDLPALVTVTQDSHPGDYPCAACGGYGTVEKRDHVKGFVYSEECETCHGGGRVAQNPLPVPSSPGHLHLTVGTPGGFGTKLQSGLVETDEDFVGASGLVPGSGTYVELDVPPASDPDDPQPRTWRYPPRSDDMIEV